MTTDGYDKQFGVRDSRNIIHVKTEK